MGLNTFSRARTVLIGASLTLSGSLLLDAGPALAAIDVTVEKTLCTAPTSCGVQSIVPGQAAYYTITLTNLTQNLLTVALAEKLPPEFVFNPATAMTCGTPSTTVPGTQGTGANSQLTYFGSILLPGNTQITGPNVKSVVCEVRGAFKTLNGQSNGNNDVTVVDDGPQHSTVYSEDPHHLNVGFDVNDQMPADISISKVVMTPSSGMVNVSGGAQTVTYKITVTNNDPNFDVAIGPIFKLWDQVAALPNSIPFTVNYKVISAQCASTSGSDCVDPPTSVASPLTATALPPGGWGNANNFLQWKYPPGSLGLLKAGGSMEITYGVEIQPPTGVSCVPANTDLGLRNRAFFRLTTFDLNKTISDADPGNDDTALSTAGNVKVMTGIQTCPPDAGGGTITVVKAQQTPQPTAGLQWGNTPVIYTFTVTNTSTTSAVFDVSIGDTISRGNLTVPFTAVLNGWTCSPTTACQAVASTQGTPVKPGTDATNRTMFTNVWIPTIAASPPACATDVTQCNTVVVTVSMTFSDPMCNANPSNLPDDVEGIVNLGTASYLPSQNAPRIWVPGFNAVTLMKSPPACPFKVTKTVPPGVDRIGFGQELVYTVTITNTDDPQVGPPITTMGAFFDTLRVNKNYASELDVERRYECVTTGTVTGLPADSGWTAFENPNHSLSGNDVNNHAVYPENADDPQKARVILTNGNTPVVFAAGSSVTCSVHVRVLRPPVNDSHCSAFGVLDNFVQIDPAATFLGASPRPVTTLWASAPPIALPKCFDLVVQKNVSPKWILDTAPPPTLDYTLSIKNLGDSIVSSGTSHPILTDTLSVVPPGTVQAPQPGQITCSNNSACAATWLGNGQLRIDALQSGQTMTVPYAVAKPFPPAGTDLCNTITTAMMTANGTVDPDWYAKSATTTSPVCVTVKARVPLTVLKSIDPASQGTVPNATFIVKVDCTPDVSDVPPKSTVLTMTPGVEQTIENVLTDSVCKITEQPTASNTPDNCHWEVEYRNGQEVTVKVSDTPTLEARNRLVCEGGGLTVIKMIDPTSAPIPEGITFPIAVTCEPGGTRTIYLPPGASQTVPAKPGAHCSIKELDPRGEIPRNCHWMDERYPQDGATTIDSKTGKGTLEVVNKLVCEGDGGLTVTKIIAPDSARIPLGVTFPFEVTCDPPGGLVTIQLTPGSSQVVPATPGAYCAFQEKAPVGKIGDTCHWEEPRYSQDGPIQIDPRTGKATLVVTNKLVCDPVDTGIVKVCKIAGDGVDIGTMVTFTVGRQTVQVPAGPAPGGYCAVAENVPVGTATVAETLLPGVSVIRIDRVAGEMGSPDLAAGTVTVKVAKGLVTVVAYTDVRRTGFLEICKAGGSPGHRYTFTLRPAPVSQSGPFTLPTGACTPPIEVPAGNVTITEEGPSVVIVGATTLPDPKRQISKTETSSTVLVVPGGIVTETIARIVNR